MWDNFQLLAPEAQAIFNLCVNLRPDDSLFQECLRTSMTVLRGKVTRKTGPGEVSSFQALATELSGTVGLGNIAGVAVATSLGGPGAALWIVASPTPTTANRH